AQPQPSRHAFRIWPSAGDLGFVRERWGVRTTGWYGMTELAGVPITSELEREGPHGAMGRVSLEYEIALRRPDGSEVDFGEVGRLWVRAIPGVSMFLEYLNNPEATAAAFDADGWFDTGDEARADADGHLFFVSRAKDMLRVGGENVAALEIE